MTQKEQAVLKITADLWNAILDLPVLHPSDMRETERDIHNIQNRIMARNVEKYPYEYQKYNRAERLDNLLKPETNENTEEIK